MDFLLYIRHRVGCVLSQRGCEVQSVPAVHWLSSHQQQTVELVRDQLGCHWKQKLCFPIYQTQHKLSVYLEYHKPHHINIKLKC